MITQKDKMLKLVLANKHLQEVYGFENTYETISEALDSGNPVVTAVAKIIKELNGSDDPGEQKRVYQTIFTYLNNNLLA
jgi:hypothetical protein